MIGIAAGAIVAEAAAILEQQRVCREAGVEYIPPPSIPMPEPKPREDDYSLLWALAFVGLIS